MKSPAQALSTAAILLGACLLVCGCHAQNPSAFKKPMQLGGKLVSADSLNRGRAVYTQYCRACHGDTGEGNGPASSGLRPPPRNFTRGIFKFGSAVSQDGAPTLPSDADFDRIIHGGLHGSAMLAWDIPQPEFADLVQYLKTFSPKWQTEAPGQPLLPSPDPWAARPEQGVNLGRKLYHGLAQCSACHAAYASKPEIAAFVKELQPNAPPPQFRTDMFLPTPVESIEYSVDGKHPLRILPPDFLHGRLKSIRAKSELPDLYRVISLGIPGAGMPPWRTTLTEEQIWAISHYVQSLIDARDTPAAAVIEKSRG
jgi:mono/diheme cytochrome c family protein